MQLAMYPREISAVTAACLLVEKSKFLSVGGLDAESLKVNFNDIDLCLKLRERGLTNIVLPLVGMIHHESKSRGKSGATPESRRQLTLEAECMRSRWRKQLQHDPYYNKNLSLSPALYQLSSNGDFAQDAEPETYKVDGDYTSLGRDARLDIYLDQSNQSRASEATAPSTIPPLSIGLPAGLSVIVLNKNSPELITPLVGQLSNQQGAFQVDGLGFEILIGDTGSTNPDTLRLYNSLPLCASVVRDMAYNFSRCNNQLEEIASYDTVLFLNNDIIFPPDDTILRRAFDRLRREQRLGILGSVLLYPNGTIQHMGCEFITREALWGLPYHIHAGKDPLSLEIPEEATYPSLTGAFLMIQRSLFRMCGCFDPKYKAECQDIALCLAAHRLGFRASCVNLGPIIHIENATRPKGEENFSDRRRFLRKYGAYIQGAFQ
jgi:GT2 family glycosyltransferase